VQGTNSTILITSRGDGKLRQDWAGALEAYQQQYTALDLQHLATKWRTE
jgi:hypothetical protein